MVRVTDTLSASGTRPVFICDFSPPRNPASNWLSEALSLKPDLFSIPYLAPRPTRPDPITAANLIRAHTRTEVAFNVATRDSSRLKLTYNLSRARDLGLQNVVVLQGDADRGVRDIPPSERFTPTELIRELKGPDWDFCVGAVADLSKGFENEAHLAQRKIHSGADFLLVQPTFDFEATEQFFSSVGFAAPLFLGVQVLVKGGISFTPTPDSLRQRIDCESAGVKVAVETIRRFLQIGIRNFYLIAPIYPGGARDYTMARQVMDSFNPTMSAPYTPV